MKTPLISMSMGKLAKMYVIIYYHNVKTYHYIQIRTLKNIRNFTIIIITNCVISTTAATAESAATAVRGALLLVLALSSYFSLVVYARAMVVKLGINHVRLKHLNHLMQLVSTAK